MEIIKCINTNILSLPPDEVLKMFHENGVFLRYNSKDILAPLQLCKIIKTNKQTNK